MNISFLAGVDNWAAGLGKLRDVVRQEVLAEQLREVMSTVKDGPADIRARVRLVVGPGEAAPDIVPGPFDAILCHGVLPYLDDLAPMLGAISGVAAPQATLSLLVRNGAAMAMRHALQGKWDEALAAFDDRDYVNRLGLAAHAHVAADLDLALAGDGWTRQRSYGVRVFTDHLETEPLPPPETLCKLLAAEREAGRQAPYRHVAALLHLVYTRS